MVTLILTNKTRLPRIEDLPEVRVMFVQSSVGALPAEQGYDYFQWWHQIKATREQLTEDLKEK